MAELRWRPAGEPVRTRHKQFGDVAAVWAMLDRLDVAAIIDEVAAPSCGRGRVGRAPTWRWRR